MRKGWELQQRTIGCATHVVQMRDRLALRGRSGQELRRQVLRPGTSIGADLEAADAAQSRADFVSKCGIALKAARETKYRLRLLSATKKIAPGDGSNDRLSESDQIIAILTTIVRKARTERAQ